VPPEVQRITVFSAGAASDSREKSAANGIDSIPGITIRRPIYQQEWNGADRLAIKLECRTGDEAE
jgi:hypothetical protein